MISLDDIKDLFTNLSRDFKLIVNDDIIMCNKQILISYSQVITTNSQELTEFSLKIPTDSKYARDIIEFLHGSFCKFEDFPFEYLCVAAFLDISILKERLFQFVENSTNENNFEQRYLQLNQFPEYCTPLCLFLDKNPIYFNQFKQTHTLTLKFAKCFLEQTTNLLKSEDQKVQFLLSLLDKSEDGLTKEDFSIFQHICLSNLSERSLFDLLTHKNGDQIVLYLNPIQLFDRQLKTYHEYLQKLNSVENDHKEIQVALDTINQQNLDQCNEFSTLNLDCFLLETKRTSFQQVSHNISKEINEIVGLFQSLCIHNDRYIEFSKQIESMHSLSQKLAKLLDHFYNNGGSVIYPGSSRDAAKYSKEWMNVSSELLQQTQTIIFDQNNVKVFLDILKSASSFFETLMPITEPPMKKVGKKK